MLLRLAAAVLQVVVASSGAGLVDPALVEPQLACTTYLWTCEAAGETQGALFLRVVFQGPGLFPEGLDAVAFVHDGAGQRITSEVCTNFDLVTPIDGQAIGCVFPLPGPVSGPVTVSLDVWGTYAGRVTAELR